MNALGRLLSLIALPFQQLLAVPLQIVSTPKRILGLSLPRRAAILVFVVLGVLATVFFLVIWFKNPNRTDTRLFYSYIATVAVLIIVNAIVVEYMVKSWLDHDVSGFPDIDEAWQHGLAELAAAGFNLSELPLFLVLGVPEEEPAKSLLAASSLKLDVTAFPAGERAPLRWFAGPSACVLVLSQAGCLSRLVAKAGEEPHAGGDDGEGEAPMQRLGTALPAAEYGRTAAPGMLPSELQESFLPTASPFGAGEQGTIMNVSPQPAYMAGGTLTPDFGAQAREQPSRGGTAARRMPPLALPKDQAETATARLDHVCRLLREERSPLCPINGLLTVLPFELVARGNQELHNSVRTDLATLRSGLRVRSQVIALFGGMEREAGFPELKRRLGPKVANDQQFGKGYNPHCPSIDEELAAVAQHACGAFEDFTYYLFAQKNERLSNPRGNRQLYALVCKIRSQQQRLEDVIVKGFAANGDSAEKPHLFSGCYFAATGDKDDRRAFVAGVFKNRLLPQDEDVEWTNDALAENDWYQWSANLLVALDVLLIGGIVTMIVIGLNRNG